MQDKMQLEAVTHELNVVKGQFKVFEATSLNEANKAKQIHIGEVKKLNSKLEKQE